MTVDWTMHACSEVAPTHQLLLRAPRGRGCGPRLACKSCRSFPREQILNAAEMRSASPGIVTIAVALLLHSSLVPAQKTVLIEEQCVAFHFIRSPR
jgi:hypothetical protein